MFRGADAVFPGEGTGFPAASAGAPVGFGFPFDGFLDAGGMIRSSLVIRIVGTYAGGPMTASIRVCSSRVTARGVLIPFTGTNPYMAWRRMNER